jgi:hypothetical protein
MDGEGMTYVDMVLNNSLLENSHEVNEVNDNQPTEFVSIGMLKEEKTYNDSTKGDEQEEEADATIVMSDTWGTLKWNGVKCMQCPTLLIYMSSHQNETIRLCRLIM